MPIDRTQRADVDMTVIYDGPTGKATKRAKRRNEEKDAAQRAKIESMGGQQKALEQAKKANIVKKSRHPDEISVDKKIHGREISDHSAGAIRETAEKAERYLGHIPPQKGSES